MSGMWTPGWVESMLAAGPDDAGFAALVAEAERCACETGERDGAPRFDSADVLAVLTGDVSTRRLPAPVAAMVAERVAARDPNAADRLCAGDDRRAVAAGLAAGAAAHERSQRTPGHAGDLAGVFDAVLAAAGGPWGAESWRTPEVVAVVSALPAPLAADLVVALADDAPTPLDIRGTSDAGEPGAGEALALAAVLFACCDIARVAAALGTSHRFAASSAQVRAAVTLGLFAADPHSGAQLAFSGARRDVAAAYRLSLAPREGPAPRFAVPHSNLSAARPSLLGWCAVDHPTLIEGPGSLAEIAGLGSLGSAPDDDIEELARMLSCCDATPSEVFAAVLTAATRGGERTRRVPASALRRASEMPPEVCFAASARPGFDVATRACHRWFLTVPAQRWTPEVFAEAFDAHPVAAIHLLTELVDIALDGAVDAPDPVWVAESMRRVGLEYWVRRHASCAAELTAAAEGIGADRWSALVALMRTFRGTPAELVELTAEVAPST